MGEVTLYRGTSSLVQAPHTDRSKIRALTVEQPRNFILRNFILLVSVETLTGVPRS